MLVIFFLNKRKAMSERDRQTPAGRRKKSLIPETLHGVTFTEERILYFRCSGSRETLPLLHVTIFDLSRSSQPFSNVPAVESKFQILVAASWPWWSCDASEGNGGHQAQPHWGHLPSNTVIFWPADLFPESQNMRFTPASAPFSPRVSYQTQTHMTPS